jgi:GMP synthase-like glutamine amidotransferase
VRILAVVHQTDAGAGVFGEATLAEGHELVEWTPSETHPPPLEGLDAAMVFGGAMHVDQEDAHPWLRAEKDLLRDLLGRRLPMLGICLGSQLLAEAAGAIPRRARLPEIGWHPIELTPDGARDPLLGALPRRFEGFFWHSYEAPLPPGGIALALSHVCLHAFRLDGAVWGLQFHPEVTSADLGSWLAGYRGDPDAVRIGLDPAALRAESAGRIEAWNELGRGIARRFLAAAEGSSPSVTRA